MNRMKCKGFATIVIIWSMLIFFFITVSFFVTENNFLNARAEKTKNDIVFSNLACYKEIDLKKLGDTPSIFNLADPNNALNVFKVYLEKNMKLDSNLNGLSNSIAIGKVSIKRYVIYNVSGKKVDIYDYNEASNTFVKTTVDNMEDSPVYTPTGVLVKNTSIHTSLNFNIDPILKGIVGDLKNVDVSQDTDITY